MSSHTFKDIVEAVAKVIDGAGITVVVIGLLFAVGGYLLAQRDAQGRSGAFRGFREHVGKSILLGLEFLVAADIIRTVAVDPTFRGVGVLAVIVAVRTFLSFTLEVELSGRWPWQSQRQAT